ncbi:MAG: DUF2934 domain-containing protein [Oxalobacteraceae bacterium]|nr:MAG: DUF2934 domain-containing protein [Oxalobacteraceae bacterium]
MVARSKSSHAQRFESRSTPPPTRVSRIAEPGYNVTAQQTDATVAAAQPKVQRSLAPQVSAGQRQAMIERAAYFRYLKRGSSHAADARQDWLQAEREIDASLAEGNGGGQSTHH